MLKIINIIFERSYINAKGYSQEEETSKVCISLEIDPAGSEADLIDDKYTLFSTDKAKKYSQTLSFAEDAIKKSESIDIHFSNVKTYLKYSLEVDPGSSGDKYYIFKDLPFDDLDME